MTRLLFLALCLSGLTASAQTMLPCTSSCPTRYYFETQACTSGTCGRSSTPSAAEFQAGKGMSLAGTYEGAMIQLCAPTGQTLSGTGTLRLWTWSPWLPGVVSTSKLLRLNVADVWDATACGGSACQCVHWPDSAVGGYSSRRVMVEAAGVGVSGSTTCLNTDSTCLSVRLAGLEVIR